MLRTVQFACTLSQDDADTLNAESGRLYTDMLVCHYRVYRRKGVWLPLPPSMGNAGRMLTAARRRCMPTAATPPSKASTKPARPPRPAETSAWR
jgi:hypothetical protein